MLLRITAVFMSMLLSVSVLANQDLELDSDGNSVPEAQPLTQAEAKVEREGPSQQSTSVVPRSASVSISDTSNWPVVLLTLLGMVICILLIAWIVRRFSGMAGLGGKDLKVKTAIAIGARERVAIIDVRGEQFLVGVTPHNISLLHRFDEAPIADASKKHTAGSSEFAEKFQGILKQSLGTSNSHKDEK